MGNVTCEIIWIVKCLWVKSSLPYNAVYFVKAVILSSHHGVLELETLLGGVESVCRHLFSLCE